MPLVLSERNVGPVTLLELSERLTIEHISELRDKLQHLNEQGRRSLLLDCSRVRVVDSTGVGALVRDWLWIKKQHGTLKLLHPSDRLREVLQLLGLQKVIECFDDISLALRAF
jgi:anti-sigma B factor antagonist